jgi:hypothetical protein
MGGAAGSFYYRETATPTETKSGTFDRFTTGGGRPRDQKTIALLPEEAAPEKAQDHAPAARAWHSTAGPRPAGWGCVQGISPTETTTRETATAEGARGAEQTFYVDVQQGLGRCSRF